MNDTTLSPQTADDREKLVLEQHETVKRNVDRTAIRLLRRILKDLAGGNGKVRYFPPNASSKHSRFVVRSRGRTASIRVTESQVAKLRAAGVGLTKSPVPLVPETLERFRALVRQTQAILPKIYLVQFSYAKGRKADNLRTFINERQQKPQPIERWLNDVLQDGADEFLSSDQWNRSTASQNIFVEICLALERLAQSQDVINTVLQKLEGAILALQAAADRSPTLMAAKVAEQDAMVKKLNEEHKPTGQDLPGLRQTYMDACRRSAEVEEPVIQQFAKALRRFYQAKALAQSE